MSGCWLIFPQPIRYYIFGSDQLNFVQRTQICDKHFLLLETPNLFDKCKYWTTFCVFSVYFTLSPFKLRPLITDLSVIHEIYHLYYETDILRWV